MNSIIHTTVWTCTVNSSECLRIRSQSAWTSDVFLFIRRFSSLTSRWNTSAEAAHVCGVSCLPHDLPCFLLLLVEASAVTPDELHQILTVRGTFEDHDEVVRVVRPVQQPDDLSHSVTLFARMVRAISFGRGFG